MARTKLKRFSRLNDLTNVFNIKNSEIKEGLQNYFNGADHFTLEIGCGQGDYSVELAQKYPKRNFIGIDVKGARIYNGAMKAKELNINNVAFVITKAQSLIEIFQPKSIEEIYIPFPDPHVRRKNQKRRLVSDAFLKLYKELITPSGLLHFKTDDQGLYEYAVKSILDFEGKILHTTKDLYSDQNLEFSQGVMTNFEKHYVNEGREIKYICFRF